MKEIFANLKTASLAAVLLTVLLCGAYPAAVGFLGRGLFPDRAGGSLIKSDAGIVGSELLARGFSGERFFHPRPSAAGEGFDALRSGGSNRGPLSRDLEEAVRVRVEAYRAENSLPDGIPVPADAVTASGSGLDPHISVENAGCQAGRVARARGRSVGDILKMVERHTEGRTLGFLGQPRVNVLRLNLDLEGALIQ